MSRPFAWSQQEQVKNLAGPGKTSNGVISSAHTCGHHHVNGLHLSRSLRAPSWQPKVLHNSSLFTHSLRYSHANGGCCRARPRLTHWEHFVVKCLAPGHNDGLGGSWIWTANPLVLIIIIICSNPEAVSKRWLKNKKKQKQSLWAYYQQGGVPIIAIAAFTQVWQMLWRMGDRDVNYWN